MASRSQRQEVSMPPARKSARSSSRTRAAFKEPAALKRLNSSLDAAQKAIAELREHAGRNAAQSTRELHKGVGTFVSSARRDAGKLSKALTREFEQAQKLLAKAPSPRSRSKSTASPRKARQSATKRTRRKAS
jgi:hypothetical protein